MTDSDRGEDASLPWSRSSVRSDFAGFGDLTPGLNIREHFLRYAAALEGSGQGQAHRPPPVARTTTAAITQNRERTTTADIGRMADVSQAPAGQDQSRSGCSGDEEDFGDFCQKPERCRAGPHQPPDRPAHVHLPRAVKAHLSHIFAKLGMSSRSHLAVDATRHGLDRNNQLKTDRRLRPTRWTPAPEWAVAVNGSCCSRRLSLCAGNAADRAVVER
jgi:hypothetical protein